MVLMSFLSSFLFKPYYVPEATGGGLASSLFVYYSHSSKYIVLKILTHKGALRNPPIIYIIFILLCFFC